VPLVLVLPLATGCLTTLAVSAVAGSGGGNEQVEQVKETASDVVEHARNAVDDAALSAHDTLKSVTD
jgi:hypothetical protein